MERRIEKKIDTYTNSFKTDIKGWLEENNCTLNGNVSHSDFLQYIFDYDGLKLTKEDFQKRKRVKNVVPHYERCTAKRANEHQCTRRKKEGAEFCGTHVKGTPHGVISNTDSIGPKLTKIDVWVEDIKGIQYHIDSNGNVYSPEDIIANKVNPNIIAKYVKEDNKYSIPTFGI